MEKKISELEKLLEKERNYKQEKLHEMRILLRILQDVKEGREIEPRRVCTAITRLIDFARDFCRAEMIEKDGLGRFDPATLKIVSK